MTYEITRTLRLVCDGPGCVGTGPGPSRLSLELEPTDELRGVGSVRQVVDRLLPRMYNSDWLLLVDFNATSRTTLQVFCSVPCLERGADVAPRRPEAAPGVPASASATDPPPAVAAPFPNSWATESERPQRVHFSTVNVNYEWWPADEGAPDRISEHAHLFPLSGWYRAHDSDRRWLSQGVPLCGATRGRTTLQPAPTAQVSANGLTAAAVADLSPRCDDCVARSAEDDDL